MYGLSLFELPFKEKQEAPQRTITASEILQQMQKAYSPQGNKVTHVTFVFSLGSARVPANEERRA
jgi:hypothetical protein